MKSKLIKRVSLCIFTILFLLSPMLVSSDVFADDCGCCDGPIQFLPYSIENGGTGGFDLPTAKGKLEIPNVVQILGSSIEDVMSQKAVTDAILSVSSTIIPISKGGTGATTAAAAVSNLGLSFTSGTWTPNFNNAGTPSFSYRSGLWRCIDFGSFHMMFISFYIIANISSVSGYADITGFTEAKPRRFCCIGCLRLYKHGLSCS